MNVRLNKTCVYSFTKKIFQVQEQIVSLDKEYLPISGLPAFTSAAANLAFGEDSEIIANKLVIFFKYKIYTHLINI